MQLGPAITKAVVLVAIPYPDAKPTESENEIVRKVEEALTELQSVGLHRLDQHARLGGHAGWCSSTASRPMRAGVR